MSDDPYPKPPTHGEEETAKNLMSQFDIEFRGQFFHERSDARRDFRNAIAAALRQRADEATEACATFLEDEAQREGDDHSAFTLRQAAAAIRARIKP